MGTAATLAAVGLPISAVPSAVAPIASGAILRATERTTESNILPPCDVT